MSLACRAAIVDEVRRHGPLTVARFMELALYHPEHGYYNTARQRSGRAGDFFTSVDVGQAFGELLAVQFTEMWRLWTSAVPGQPIDLVEAGAGNGRLAADILNAAATNDPDFYSALQISLVERSPAARAAQPDALGRHLPKLRYTGESLPARIDGILYANELLDALPTHVVVMRDTLREIYIDWNGTALAEREGAPSTAALQEQLDRGHIELQSGWKVEINLEATRWVADAARRLARGFLLLIDYGHDARELYGASHSSGTLTTHQRHVSGIAGVRLKPDSTREGEDARHRRDVESGFSRTSLPWLKDPGSVDMTSHVDLTAVQRVAEDEGLETIAVLDQTYFLLGLGLGDRLARHEGADISSLKARLALKTLMLPGGLGSVQKVMIFGKGVGQPKLRGCSYKVRVT